MTSDLPPVFAALRNKYDVRGPRYTSYPPANHFHAINLDRLYSCWKSASAIESPSNVSIYVHLPFCRSRCLFCGCHTQVVSDQAIVSQYVDTLLKEMKLASALVDASRPVIKIALGGGTPNFLSEEQIALLLQGLEKIWSVAPLAERSVEIDPRTATASKLDVFRSHGFNRFSLGVQDLDDQVLRRIRPHQDLMQVEEVVNHLRRRGCEAINFDLIYGLPGQTVSTVQRTIAQVVDLSPSRIALYSYAHVPWIHRHQQALEKQGLPDADLKFSMFFQMGEWLQAAGYRKIGLDHFARPDDLLVQAQESGQLRRDFMGYTTARGVDLLGFGASAIANIGPSYSQNEKDLAEYTKTIAAGHLPIVRGYLLSPDDQMRRELIIDLSCNLHLDLDTWGRRFQVNPAEYLAEDLARLQPLIDDGLVSMDGLSIKVSEIGRFFMRNICMAFDRHLETDAPVIAYSRTV